MTSYFLTNGKIQLVLKPDNETDKFLLEKLLGQGELKIEASKGTLLETNVADGAVIKLKSEVVN